MYQQYVSRIRHRPLSEDIDLVIDRTERVTPPSQIYKTRFLKAV
jgi:hypothetical protein